MGRQTLTPLSPPPLHLKPGTKAVAVDSGYIRVSGEWMWCSGIDHCDWCSLMTPVPQPSGPPDLVMVLLKRGDYTVRRRMVHVLA